MARSGSKSLALCVALALAFVATTPCSAQETVADYVKLAQDKAGARDYEAALAIYDQILAQFPKEFVSIYAERATVRELAMDFPGAIADYDTVLKLDPVDPAKAQMIRPRIHEARGKLRMMVEDYPGAIADLTAALAGDPKASHYNPYDLSQLHKDRAEARRFNGDGKGAIADYDAALKLDPDDSFLLSDRAEVKRELRNYDGAIADYTASIAHADKPSSLTYQERGIARLCKGDLALALEDFEKDASVGLADDQAVYHSPIVHETHLLIWALRARLQGREKADAWLTEHLASARRSGDPDTNWEIAEYFLGKQPESKIIANAKGGSAQLTVANYHIGLKQLVDGDTAGARTHFNAVLKSDESMHYMNELARAELGRLAPPKPQSR